MKSLIAGIVLIIVLGIGGFIYRNVAERTGGPAPIACTMEAKVCPDGSSVGRSGPDCAFAACAFPNIELSNVHIAFVVPNGYAPASREQISGGLINLVGTYVKAAAGEASLHTISIYDYPIPGGKTGNDVIVANTEFSPSGEPAKDMSKFKPIIVNGRTFQSVVIERFEGQVESSYYLVRDADVLRFDIVEKDVDWTNPDLVVANLPEHKALVEMLGTLQTP